MINYKFEAAWSLTNIASGTSSNTATAIKHDAIPHVVELMLNENKDVAEQAV